MSFPKLIPAVPGRPALPGPHVFLLGVLVSLMVAGCATPFPERATTSATPAPETPEPADTDMWVKRAETALENKRYREAAEDYARAAATSEDETLIAQAAKVAYDCHQMALVSQIATHWLTINPTSESGIRYAAFAALDLYRLDEAAMHFDALLNAAYINVAAGFLGLGPQMSTNGSPAAVTTVLKTLVAKYPDVAEGHHALAQAALRSENVPLAEQSAERAYQLSPYWSPAGLLLARVQLVVGKTDAGLATAKTVIDRDESDGNHLEYALLLLAADKETEGLAELGRAAAGSDDSAAVVERILALRDFESGRFEAAASRFDKLIQKGAFVYESLYFLGNLAEQRQSWEEARRNYSRVVGGDYAVNAQTRLARILNEYASLDAALAWLADFGESKPQYAIETITARSRLLEQSGDTAGARLLLDESLQVYPDEHDLVMARSALLERTDDLRGALTDLERLNGVRVGDPVVQNSLGYLLVDRTRRYKEGFELIRQAHEQSPDSGPVLDSMGWALHRLGRNAEALPYLEQARERIYDPDIELHIGDVFWSLGRKEDARMTWEQGRTRHPEKTGFTERLERYFPK